MKCPACGAWTLVRETRRGKDGAVVRVRVCGNFHRFRTAETPLPRREAPREH